MFLFFYFEQNLPSCSHSSSDLLPNKGEKLKPVAEQTVEKNNTGHCFGKNVCHEIKFKPLTTSWAQMKITNFTKLETIFFCLYLSIPTVFVCEIFNIIKTRF